MSSDNSRRNQDTDSKKSRGIRVAALVLCGIVALYLLTIVAYALLNYSEFASDMPRLVRYVIGPFAIASILLVLAITLPADTSRTIGIVATSCLAALFLFEVVMTIRTYPSTLAMFGYGVDKDETKRYRKGLPPAFTFKALNNELGTTSLREAVLGGIPGAEVLLCLRDGQKVTYVSDRFGYRNPDAATELPIDVMVIGDSFAEGICLDDGTDIVSRLRDRIPSTAGFGTRGAGPLYELAVLGRYGPFLKPKLTIFAFFAGNDWENLEGELKSDWLPEALRDDADFGTVDTDAKQADRTKSVIASWWDNSALTIAEAMSRRRDVRNFFALQKTASVLGLHYGKAPSRLPVYEDVLERAQDIAAEWGGEIGVVYMPQVNRFIGLLDPGYAFDPLRKKVREMAERSGVPFMDLTDTFTAITDDPRSLYAADAHLSEEGAEIAGHAIADWSDEAFDPS